jgi:hypothetical protein
MTPFEAIRGVSGGDVPAIPQGPTGRASYGAARGFLRITSENILIRRAGCWC